MPVVAPNSSRAALTVKNFSGMDGGHCGVGFAGCGTWSINSTTVGLLNFAVICVGVSVFPSAHANSAQNSALNWKQPVPSRSDEALFTCHGLRENPAARCIRLTKRLRRRPMVARRLMRRAKIEIPKPLLLVKCKEPRLGVPSVIFNHAHGLGAGPISHGKPCCRRARIPESRG